MKISCRGGRCRYVTIHPMKPTIVVEMSLNPDAIFIRFSFSTNDSGCFVFV